MPRVVCAFVWISLAPGLRAVLADGMLALTEQAAASNVRGLLTISAGKQI